MPRRKSRVAASPHDELRVCRARARFRRYAAMLVLFLIRGFLADSSPTATVVRMLRIQESVYLEEMVSVVHHKRLAAVQLGEVSEQFLESAACARHFSSLVAYGVQNEPHRFRFWRRYLR